MEEVLTRRLPAKEREVTDPRDRSLLVDRAIKMGEVLDIPTDGLLGIIDTLKDNPNVELENIRNEAFSKVAPGDFLKMLRDLGSDKIKILTGFLIQNAQTFTADGEAKLTLESPAIKALSEIINSPKLAEEPLKTEPVPIVKNIELEHQREEGVVKDIKLEHELADQSRIVPESVDKQVRRFPAGLVIHSLLIPTIFLSGFAFLTCPLVVFSLFAISPYYKKMVKEKRVGEMTLQDLDQIIGEIDKSKKVPEETMKELRALRDSIADQVENESFPDRLKSGTTIPTRVGVSDDLPGNKVTLNLKDIVILAGAAQDEDYPNLQKETIDQMLAVFNHVKENSDRFNAINSYDELINFVREAGVNFEDERNIFSYISDAEKPFLFDSMKKSFNPKNLDESIQELEGFKTRILSGEEIGQVSEVSKKLGQLRSSTGGMTSSDPVADFLKRKKEEKGGLGDKSKPEKPILQHQ